MKNMSGYKKITEGRMIDLIGSTKSSTFITVRMAAEPSWARKKNNPFLGKVEKVQTFSGLVNFDYEKSVNTSLAKQGKTSDFKAQKPAAWGTRVGNTCIIEHNGSFYVDMEVLRSLKVKYTIDGKAATKAEVEEIKTWLPIRKAPTNGSTVIVRRPAFRNITHIHCLGTRYKLV